MGVGGKVYGEPELGLKPDLFVSYEVRMEGEWVRPELPVQEKESES